ncbi:hypothetical protein C8Q80DRAFT_428380 [Daedaleopsis nitida]|nr:hypothetical protein C8Q80DRAFT_428380 [Daedaleopsis nitida]
MNHHNLQHSHRGGQTSLRTSSAVPIFSAALPPPRTLRRFAQQPTRASFRVPGRTSLVRAPALAHLCSHVASRPQPCPSARVMRPAVP